MPLPDSTVDRLADEMVAGWANGVRAPAEVFLDRHPHLRDDPAAVLELIAEELALRTDAGENVSPAGLIARFPEWAEQVLALCACQRALGPQFPNLGDDLGEFTLLGELGRGAHGRVYLAAQAALGGRPVVLKVAPEGNDEHLSLARLQHANIVPLYSAHDFPDCGLHALCMPYFGGTTLAALLTTAAEHGGKGLLAALGPAAVGDQPQPRGSAREFLENASFGDAVCWIGACLADALQYAHDRGLLHLDIKPSNVLIAADGVPMLLDFHLARPPLVAGEAAPRWLGGTRGFMAPEQAAAVDAVRTASPVREAVDGRADVYALGVLLTSAFEADPGGISVGLADILARCAASRPEDRYPSAMALAVDLRRHLGDLPLLEVYNRSLRERWTKWRRRRPQALPLILVVLALFTAVSGAGIYAVRQVDRAREALRSGEEHLRRGRFAEATETFRGGEALIRGWPITGGVAGDLHLARRIGERGQAAADLHAFCEQIRPLYAAKWDRELVRPVAQKCETVWMHRDEIVRRLSESADGDSPSWRADLLDLGILTAHLHVVLHPDDATAANEAALRILDETEKLLGPGGVLSMERATCLHALGRTVEAMAAETRASTFPPRSAWELVVVGRTRLQAGDVPGAVIALDRGLALEPSSLWAHFYRGECALRQNAGADAIAAFTACVALAPHVAWCHFNLGLAYRIANQPERAKAAFVRAVEYDTMLAAQVPQR